MTFRSEAMRQAWMESQLAQAHAHIAALARTHHAACVERDALRAEVDAARAALGAAWTRGTLAEGIKQKCRWLEAMIDEAEGRDE